ncbi:MAG: alpha/beta hydrolase [Anaerolineae bacterium]|nr:alpha/beta hydrolase [Anaerolineae bacterium]
MTAPADHTCYLEKSPDWPSGYAAWLPKRVASIRSVGYTLVDLVRRGLLDAAAVELFSEQTLLADFAWRVLWVDEEKTPDAESLADKFRYAEGFLIFIHGWVGSGDIWEDLPALVLKRNPKLIALIPDVNGFGGTPFKTPLPPIDKCDPPANMRAVELWLDMLGIRQADCPYKRPFIFVGHSMGAASVFFLDTENWEARESGRIALAPALLMNDRQRQRLYKTLGTGIRISGWSDTIDHFVERIIAPRLIAALAGAGSSLHVRAQHKRIFDMTPEGVIAQTFAAMGQLEAQFDNQEWPDFITFLGDKDVLVGLQPTLDLLLSINFRREQIRIVQGDHYFFSVGGAAEKHRGNRDLVVEDILAMQSTMSSALQE